MAPHAPTLAARLELLESRLRMREGLSLTAPAAADRARWARLARGTRAELKELRGKLARAALLRDRQAVAARVALGAFA